MLDVIILAGLFALAGYCWYQIRNWFTRKKLSHSDYGELRIAERLATGQYKVVSGVFGGDNVLLYQAEWVVDDTQETRSVFNGTQKVRIKI